MIKRKIYDLPSDKIREARAEGKAEGRAEGKHEGRANFKRDLKLVVPYLKEGKDNKCIAEILNIPIETVQECREVYNAVLS